MSIAPQPTLKTSDKANDVEYPTLSYQTVRDYCDSADRFPSLARYQYDLKDAQRPWMVKRILESLKPGAKLLEIGGGEPLAASLLASHGYEVTVCDPLDGTAFGPQGYDEYVKRFPEVELIQELFDADMAIKLNKTFDCIFSISVVEHIAEQDLQKVYDGIDLCLAKGGYCMHAIDHVFRGKGQDQHEAMLNWVVAQQKQLAGTPASKESIKAELDSLLHAAHEDLETYYLSALGHNLWRGQMSYEEFPFRKCISVQSVVRRPQ
ncbi:Class I SAM-dependent methyltransferase [Planctomycetales bacterium 10988]|nr:Class I SAM-dependent methyltransferase [Planctomycetales bacterium 10988]